MSVTWRSLSQTAHLPSNSRRSLRDPYAERHGVARTIAAVVVVLALAAVAWRFGWLDSLLPAGLQRGQPVVVVRPA